MAKPLGIPGVESRIASLEKRMRKLERRGAGPWHFVGDSGEPAFQNGWSNAGGALQGLRYRWLLGGGIEVQGSVAGGSLGTVVFTLPIGYRPDGGTVITTGVGATNNIVVWTIAANGDVKVDTAS